jgi:hypothetical protein
VTAKSSHIINFAAVKGFKGQTPGDVINKRKTRRVLLNYTRILGDNGNFLRVVRRFVKLFTLPILINSSRVYFFHRSEFAHFLTIFLGWQFFLCQGLSIRILLFGSMELGANTCIPPSFFGNTAA